MGDSEKPSRADILVPFLALFPIVTLALMSWLAFDLYFSGADPTSIYPRNLNEPWWIAGITWAFLATTLATAFAVELILMKKGKDGHLPPVAIASAAMFNIFLGFLGYSSDTFGCGVGGYVPPEARLAGALELTFITYGLAVAAIACIKFKSLRGVFAGSAMFLSAANYFLASIALFVMMTSVCLGGG